MNIFNRKAKPVLQKRAVKIAAVILALPVCCGLLFGVLLAMDFTHPTSDFPQLSKIMLPFGSTRLITTSEPAPIPAPESYEEALKSTDAVILGTIENKGVYSFRRTSPHMVPVTERANLIYTVRIDRVLYGTVNGSYGGKIPVTEDVWCRPRFQLDGVVLGGWNFELKSVRPEKCRNLKNGRQYLFFLQSLPPVGYFIPYNFCVFTQTYIDDLSKQETMAEVEDHWDNSPVLNDYEYKIIALSVKRDFLSKH